MTVLPPASETEWHFELVSLLLRELAWTFTEVMEDFARTAKAFLGFTTAYRNDG